MKRLAWAVAAALLASPVHGEGGGPHRIVSLAPNMTEMVYALGGGALLVGDTDQCDWPPEARKLEKVGGSWTPSIERILGLHPDLVLAHKTANPIAIVRRLEALGVPVYGATSSRYADLVATARDLGGRLGLAARGEAFARSLEDRARGVADRARGLPAPRVLFVLWEDPLFVASPESFVGDLLRLAGGRNVVPPGRGEFPKVSYEEVLSWAPEVIVLASHPLDPGKAGSAERWARFPQIPAVASGRIERGDPDLLLRPGPRSAEGLEALERLFHPASPPPGRRKGEGSDAGR